MTEPRRFHPSPHQPISQTARSASYRVELRPRVLTVTAVTDLSATMRRVSFSADDDFDGLLSQAAGDHVKLFFDQDEQGVPRLPAITNDRWSKEGATYRDYTIRWFDPGTCRIDIDFVRHDHGIAGRWASQAAIGQRLGMLGPRNSRPVKDVFASYVLAADETALPALAKWAEMLRPGVPVTAYIEVAGPASQLELPSAAALDVVWLHRNGAEPGTTTLLPDAVLGHDFSDSPTGLSYVWAAGEAQAMQPIRRYLANELKLPRDQWQVSGYWRRGIVNHDHHADEGDDHVCQCKQRPAIGPEVPSTAMEFSLRPGGPKPRN
ncbi:MAG: NADPH-dependent ferric siderophore reductase [Propionibacterium sp.]|nr:MAG: NADPH-dependent ferric siderophore reductase [Propionibacterium sp.]